MNGPFSWRGSLVDAETGRFKCCGADALRLNAFHAAGCPAGVELPAAWVRMMAKYFGASPGSVRAWARMGTLAPGMRADVVLCIHGGVSVWRP